MVQECKIFRGRDLGDSDSVFVENGSVVTAPMSLKGSAKQVGQSRVSLWLGVRCLGLSSETPYVDCFARAGVGARAWGISRAPGGMFARAGGLLHIVVAWRDFVSFCAFWIR